MERAASFPALRHRRRLTMDFRSTTQQRLAATMSSAALSSVPRTRTPSGEDSRAGHRKAAQFSALKRLLSSSDGAQRVAYDPVILRQLFRAIDTNHDQAVTTEELRAGLVELGFEGASNVAATNKLLEEMDTRRDGTVDEHEFITYFRKMTSQSLAEKLRMLAEVSNVTITSTEFTESLSEPMVTGVPISNLETWLPKQLAEDHKLWLDVNGYDESVSAMIADVAGIPPHLMRDSAVLQREKVTLALPVGTSSGISAPAKPSYVSIMRMPSLSEKVLREEGTPRGSACGAGAAVGGSADGSVVDDGDVAVDVSEGKVEIVLHLLQLKNSPVVGGCLVSKQQLEAQLPSIQLHQLSILIIDGRLLVTLTSSDSAFAECFAVIKESMTFTETTQDLAFDIIQEVVERNFRVRDELVEWQKLLEVEINATATQAHSRHLYYLTRLAELLLSNLSPLTEAVEPSRWGDSVLGQYFAANQNDVLDVWDSLTTMTTSVKDILEAARGLQTLFQTQQAERMNRHSFLLVIATTTFLPTQALSGIYGTNFETFPELRWKWSYLVFWIVIIVISSTVVYLFKRNRFF